MHTIYHIMSPKRNTKTARRRFYDRSSLEILFFFIQLAMKKPPITTAVPAIWMLQTRAIPELRAWLNAKKIYKIPARINAIAPTTSRFQEIIRIMRRIRVGMLCMKSPTTVSQKLYPLPKTSSEKRARKAMNMMDNILGVQNTNLLISFFMTLLYQPAKTKTSPNELAIIVYIKDI